MTSGRVQPMVTTGAASVVLRASTLDLVVIEVISSCSSDRNNRWLIVVVVSSDYRSGECKNPY